MLQISMAKIVLSTIIRGLKAVRLDFECEYDAYIAYDHDSEADCNFMVKKLLPALDNIKDGTEKDVSNIHENVYKNADLADT